MTLVNVPCKVYCDILNFRMIDWLEQQNITDGMEKVNTYLTTYDLGRDVIYMRSFRNFDSIHSFLNFIINTYFRVQNMRAMNIRYLGNMYEMC